MKKKDKPKKNSLAFKSSIMTLSCRIFNLISDKDFGRKS